MTPAESATRLVASLLTPPEGVEVRAINNNDVGNMLTFNRTEPCEAVPKSDQYLRAEWILKDGVVTTAPLEGVVHRSNCYRKVASIENFIARLPYPPEGVDTRPITLEDVTAMFALSLSGDVKGFVPYDLCDTSDAGQSIRDQLSFELVTSAEPQRFVTIDNCYRRTIQ